MARVSDGTGVPVFPVPVSSSSMGSPDGSPPDLDGTGFLVSMMEEKINEIFTQIASFPPLMQSLSRFEKCVQRPAQTVASHDAKSRAVRANCNGWADRQPVLQ